MYPVICHLFGPFTIYSYGVCIALGVVVSLLIARFDKRIQAVLNFDQISAIWIWGIIASVIGGRLLYVLEAPEQFETWADIFAFWDAGFAVLGSLIAGVLAISLYIWRHGLPFLRVLDIAGLFAPLLQGFGRIGCFCAGCCYGSHTTSSLAITFTHPLSLAPLCIPLHPVQLYSAAALFVLFFVFYFSPLLRSPGVVALSSFMGLAAVRYATDFIRGDREVIGSFWGLGHSYYQLMSLGIMAVCLVLLVTLLVLRSYKKV